MESMSNDLISKFEKHNEKSLKNKELALKILEKLINLSSHLDVSDAEKYKIYSESISTLSKVVVESDFLMNVNNKVIKYQRERSQKF